MIENKPNPYTTGSNPPGSGLKRPESDVKKRKCYPVSKRPSEQPPYDPLNAVLRTLPAEFCHNLLTKQEVNSMLHEEISKHKNYDMPIALPDKLPKNLSTPFQFWLKSLSRQGATFPRN